MSDGPNGGGLFALDCVLDALGHVVGAGAGEDGHRGARRKQIVCHPCLNEARTYATDSDPVRHRERA